MTASVVDDDRKTTMTDRVTFSVRLSKAGAARFQELMDMETEEAHKRGFNPPKAGTLTSTALALGIEQMLRGPGSSLDVNDLIACLRIHPTSKVVLVGEEEPTNDLADAIDAAAIDGVEVTTCQKQPTSPLRELAAIIIRCHPGAGLTLLKNRYPEDLKEKHPIDIGALID